MAKDKDFKEPDFNCDPFGAPGVAGVYAICVTRIDRNKYPSSLRFTKVVYIGSSYNIRQRLQSTTHIYRRLFVLLKSYTVSCFWKATDDHCAHEILLIKKYRPRFNRTHNG